MPDGLRTEETAFSDARIVTPDGIVAGSLLARNGRIAAVDAGAAAGAGAIDCAGDLLIPGLVELHTDHLETKMAPRPGVHWPVRSAVLAHDATLATSGITTVLNALSAGTFAKNARHLQDLSDAAEAIRALRAAGALRIDHLIHLRCEICFPRVLEGVEPFRNDPLLRLISLMDHTPGQRQFVDLDRYRAYYTGKHGMSDAEVDAAIDAARTAQHEYGDRHSRALASFAAGRGVPLASHDDATEAHVDEARALGITISEFPTTSVAAAAARAAGMTTIGGAPNLVRGGSHSGNVAVADLARGGTLDALSSDYVPPSLIEGAFLLHRDLGMPLESALETVTSTPAGMVGLDDRGRLVPGLRADLVRVRVMDDGMPLVRAVWSAGRRAA